MDDSAVPRFRLSLLEELFARAQEIPAEERFQTVAEWCNGDDELLEELRELLRSDQQVEAKIATAGDQQRALSLQQESGKWYEEWIGRELGSFRIERLLGEGGMGAVFYARRFGGDVEQEAAIKVISRRVHSTAARQQFLVERDTLAKMQHPNIARLLDASFTADGQPYVVMEYVHGVSLQEACDDPAATPSMKLSWLTQLCGAVDFVHRLLILHRDLKPGNVLVTEQGVVKLLDFGTAKLLAPEYGESAMTQAEIRLMTLRYASPEQIAGAPLTTASDLYSLGVILYCVLSGETPEIAERDELLPPSIRRARTQRSPFSSVRRLCRDLDAIAQKAMLPVPAERYVNAGSLAEDIRAAELDRPTTARRENWPARSVRFLRRRWRPVLSVAAVLLCLTAGMLAVQHQSQLERESIARDRRGLAQEQALAHMLLFDFFEQLKSIPGSTEVQRQTVSEATAYLDHIASAQHNQDAVGLREDVVDAYTKMGNVMGNPYEENLGDTQGAIQTLQKAVTLARALRDQNPKVIAHVEALALAEQSLGRVYFTSGRPKDALKPMRAAAEAGSEVADHSGATSEQIAESASLFDSLGDLFGLPGAPNLHDLVQARAAYERALSLHREALAQDASCLRCQRGIAVESWKLGLVTEDRDPSFALASLHRGLDTIAAMAPTEQASAKTRRIDNVLRNTLGSLQLHTGDARGSLVTLAPVHKRFSEAIQLDPIDDRARFDRIALDLDLGEAHGTLGSWTSAASFYDEALADTTRLLEKDRTNPQWATVRARALIGLGDAQMRLGNPLGSAHVRDGIALAIMSAERNDSDADALSLAAKSILDHPQSVQDAGALAMRFAAQSIAASGNPTEDQRNMLEKAKVLARKR